MKLPSVTYLTRSAARSFTRFPLSIIASLLAVITAIHMIENEGNISNMLPYVNCLLSCALGIPLFFCVVVVCEKMQTAARTKALVTTLSAGVLVLIYFSLPDVETTHNTTMPYFRYVIYNSVIHLFVSVLPFWGGKSLNGFWQYNRILFLRFLASLLYCGVLYIGLALALGALKLLFDIRIEGELYFELFIITLGFMNTWFFVSGIPEDLSQLNQDHSYPKGLRLFSQYILLPLLALYLLILFFYGGKILLYWDWPKGIVSYLIVCISVLGSLTFLLLHPFGDLEESRWIRGASRGFYFCLIPLLVLVFIAIIMRVSDYGITINRYIIITLGIWISVVCIYTISGRSNIRFIPSSLAVIMLVVSFGPWSMFSVSERNQVDRLRQILTTGGIMKDGNVQGEVMWNRDSIPEFYAPVLTPNEGKLNDSLHNEVYSILNYLDDHHGFAGIRQWFRQDIDSLLSQANDKKEKYDYYSEPELYMRSMGLEHRYIYEEDHRDYIDFSSSSDRVISVAGWDFIVEFNHNAWAENEVVSEFKIKVDRFLIEFSKKHQQLSARCNDKQLLIDPAKIIDPLRKKYQDDYNNGIPQDKMLVDTILGSYKCRFVFDHFHILIKGDSTEIQNFSGTLFLKNEQQKVPEK